MRNAIIYCIVLLFGSIFSCYISTAKNNHSSEEPGLSGAEQALDVKKFCIKADDCKAYDQDCCGAGKWVVVNDVEALSVRGLRNILCNREYERNPDMCKDKKPTAKPPSLECKDNQCSIKSEEKAEKEKVAVTCQYDYECYVMDQDCCETGSDLIAVNVKDSLTKKQEKLKRCREEIAANKELCKGKRRMFIGDFKPVLCEKGQCVIK